MYLQLEDLVQPEFLKKYISAAIQYRTQLLQYHHRLNSVLRVYEDLITTIESNERQLRRELKKIEPQLKKLYEAEEKELTKLFKVEKAEEKEVKDRLKQVEKRSEDLLKIQKKLAKELHDVQMKGHGKENKKVRELIARLQEAAQEYQELSRQAEQIRKGKMLIPVALKGQEDAIREKYAIQARHIRERVHNLELEFNNILMELFYHISTLFSQSIHPTALASHADELRELGCPEELINRILLQSSFSSTVNFNQF